MSTSAPDGADRQEQLRLAFENAPIGIAIVRLDGRFARVNPALCAITGYSPEQLLNVAFQQITHADDLTKNLHQAAQLLDGTISTSQMEKRYLRPDGSSVWVNLSASIARDDDGEPLYFITHVEDITSRVAAREALEHHALHDQLTGLTNRQYLMERLHQALELVARRGHEIAVLFCDIDRFKAVNDVHGHEAGDQVLIEVARRISSVLRASDTAARVGGDEFVILCEDLASRDEAFRVVARLRSAMTDPIGYHAQSLAITLSIGVSFSGSGTEDRSRLLHAADEAMYREKAQHRARSASASLR